MIPASESRRGGGSVARAILVAFVALTCGCERGVADLPEWTPADHNNNEKAAPAAMADPGAQPPAEAPQGMPGQDDGDMGVVFLAWKNECVRCHGPRGQGDGPESPMVHAPDLSRASFQDRASDEDIAAVIRNGRGKMPAHPQLPPKVVDALVQLIRKMRAEP